MWSRNKICLSLLFLSILTFFAAEVLAQSEDVGALDERTISQSPGTSKLHLGPKPKVKKKGKSDQEEDDEKKSEDKRTFGPGMKSPVKGSLPGAMGRPALPSSLSSKGAKMTPPSGGKSGSTSGKAKNDAKPSSPTPPGKSSGVRGGTSLPGQKGKPSPPSGSSTSPPTVPSTEPPASLEIKELAEGELTTMDIYEMELLEFVKQMSQKFKVNFILSDKIKGGKVTIISPNKITREAAWQAFLSTLYSKELTLTKVGKFYHIISSRDAQRSPMKTYLEGGTTDPSEEIITYLFKPKYIDVKDVDRILKDLKSKSGVSIIFEPANTVIITDTAINIRRMVKIINELDTPSGRDSIHVIDIYYADAADVADKLQQIFGDKGKGRSTTGRKGKKSTESADASSVTITNIIADERTNQLIIVAPRDAMSKIVDMINRLDVPIPGDGQVHVYYLENANAEELASTLTGLAGRGTSRKKGKKSKSKSSSSGTTDLFEGEVKITADKATNSLVIVASTKDFNSLKKVIARLDLRRRQVFVEAVIMEVTLKKDNATGVAMNGGYAFDIGGETVPVFAGTTLGSMSSIALNPTTLTGLAVGLKGPDLAGTEGLLGPGISIPAFGVVLQMLQIDSDANVLSTPHILTMDNEEAEIIVGSNVPFITGQARDSNNRPVLSIQRQDVALTMKIKPQINESDFVRLQVQQEITELVSISETLGPTTTKRAAKSTVVVKDSQTIVIGGLLRDRQTNDAEKVPFLGDLPVIGRLFRRDKELKEKTNLLIFLTPHIIKDEADFQRIFKRKMDERREFLQRFYGTDEDYEFSIDYSQKTGIVETIRSTYEKQEIKRLEKDKEKSQLIISPDDDHNPVEIGETDSGIVSYGSDSDDDGNPASESAGKSNWPDKMPTAEQLRQNIINIGGEE